VSRLQFPSTLWSVVLAAGEGSDQALETLAARYAGPIFGAVRSRTGSREEAEDLTQEFFLHLLKGRLALADPNRGRFRGFLFTALRRFLSDQRDRAAALKRGGDRRKLSFDVEGAERTLALCTDDDPQRRFDRHWALDVLGRAMERARAQVTPATAEAFALAQPPHLLSHKEIGARLGLKEAAVAAATYRFRKKLEQAIRDELGATVTTPEDLAEELADLFRALDAS
jgi:RNA polymerase sigma-70 factor (ECF subfamily)